MNAAAAAVIRGLHAVIHPYKFGELAGEKIRCLFKQQKPKSARHIKGDFLPGPHPLLKSP
jgi:hypothetical protein